MHAMVKKARELTSQKKFDEAINLLKPLIKSPYMEEVLFQCGKTMIHAGKEKEAWVYFDELIDVNEDNKYSVYLWLAKHKSFAESNIKMGEEYYKIAISDESPVRDTRA